MKKLLIVVDMLNDFCAEAGVLARSQITGELYGQDIIAPVLKHVNLFRAANDAIIWLGDAHAEDDEEFKRFPPHAVRNTWGAQIVEGLAPHIVDKSSHELYMPKTRYSGFYGTDLEYQLMRIAADETTVVGVCTSICVMDTVGGLANRDQNVVVPEDAVADFDPSAHEGAMARMAGLYGAKIV